MSSITENTSDIQTQFNANAMAETVLKWSNMNTGSFNVPGIKTFAKEMIQAFSPLECETEVLNLAPLENINNQGVLEKHEIGPMLSFSKRKDAPVKILLTGHMDTVFGPEHSFQSAFRQDNEILRGPGVTDMKGGICVMLEALKAFEKTKFASRLGWEVLLNPDEELGSFGSAPIMVEKAKDYHLGLIFEPAMDESGTLAGQRKGSANFTIIVRGVAAHAGRDFHHGKNAIVAMADIIEKINQLNGQREGVTINVGYITGGGATNIVPDFSLIRLDIRIMDVEDQPWVQTMLNKIIEEAKQKEGYIIELHGKFNRPPKKIEGKTKNLYELIVKLGQEFGLNLNIRLSGGCCDGNNLAAAGLPNVDSLGVCGGKIHSSDEYLLVNSLAKRAELTLKILTYVSEHGF